MKVRGMIVGIDPWNPVASIIYFQMNPDTMTRSVTARTAGEGANDREALRLKGPPEETISVDLDFDSAGKESIAGVTPQLAALEMLLYPKSALVVANAVLSAAGMVEILPPSAPLTIFMWGPARTVPVRITKMTIVETLYDSTLNPIQATAKLEMTVLTYQDLGLLSAGGALFMTHQVQQEVLASIAALGK